MKRPLVATVCALYLGVIVVANLISAHYGPGASIYNAFVLVGFAITTRDFLHDAWREHRLRNMAVLIVAGSALSYLCAVTFASSAAPSVVVARIALASCVAFGVAESLDGIAYHVLRRREWLERSNVSNLVSATLDSVLFVTIAFGFRWPIIFGQLCAKIAGGFVWSLAYERVVVRRRVIA
jgi:queuosine precursor transporter